MERTLVLVKPDGVHKGYIGEVIKRLEGLSLTLRGLKLMQLSDEILKEHYGHLADKPFFPGIVSFMQASPVVAMIWEGENVVSRIRDLAGVTDSTKAGAGTIRGDLGVDIQYNVLHASDSPESAEVEVHRFFAPGEIFSYERQPEKFA